MNLGGQHVAAGIWPCTYYLLNHDKYTRNVPYSRRDGRSRLSVALSLDESRSVTCDTFTVDTAVIEH